MRPRPRGQGAAGTAPPPVPAKEKAPTPPATRVEPAIPDRASSFRMRPERGVPALAAPKSTTCAVPYAMILTAANQLEGAVQQFPLPDYVKDAGENLIKLLRKWADELHPEKKEE
jgi:hypothetical protein